MSPPSNHISNTDYHAWLNDQAQQHKQKRENMKVADIYPSKNPNLQSSDIGDREINVTICSQGYQTFKDDNGEDEEKFCIGFKETEKGLALNVTNLRRLEHLLQSNETDAWMGKRITLVVEPCMSFGKPSQGIRVKMALPDQTPAGAGIPVMPAAQAPAMLAGDILDKDDIVF